MRAAVLVMAICAAVGCSMSGVGKALNVGVVGAKVADQASTDRAEARGYREGNPLLGDQQWRQVVAGVVGVSGVMAAAFLLEEKSHPVMAHIVRAIAIGVWSAAALRNVVVARGAQ